MFCTQRWEVAARPSARSFPAQSTCHQLCPTILGAGACEQRGPSVSLGDAAALAMSPATARSLERRSLSTPPVRFANPRASREAFTAHRV
eukprot:2786392-Pleurochrysis_carterae.AAC.3